MKKEVERIDVNYKNNKRYKTAKYPIRQPLFFTWLIWVLSKIMLIGKKYKIEKVNMEGLKPPYILLSNHMQFIDFELVAVATYPHRLNNIVSVDGYYKRAWLMELIGCIATRKFTQDLYLVKSIMHCLRRGDVVCMYPEARYSSNGTTAYIPESVGKLIKLSKVPVVVALHHGNYLYTPFWNFRRKRKVPLKLKLTKILTPEQIKEMSVEEINAKLIEEFQYDEYKYQKENNILIKEPFRAEGLHKILYQCPHCLKEAMNSKDSEIYCEECGKRWNLNEDGSLVALNGETKFTHIPDWFKWERQQVREQVRNGTYYYEDEVEVYSLPRCNKFIPLGKAHITHDHENGFILEGTYRGETYRIPRRPLEINSLHLEYDHLHLKPFDCFDITTENDSFFCYPSQKNVLTKLGFATEEIYLLNMEK